MAQRIKGQDTTVEVLVNGQAVIVAGSPIRNFELTPKFSKLEEQYLGDPSKRYDEIFDGVDFKMDMNFEDDSVIRLIEVIRNRAIGQTNAGYTAATINIRTTLNFPGGARPVIVLQDCFFENLPITFGGREQYGQFTLSGSCSNFSRI